ncbi:MAG TPA: Gmad2 immunoglobulin-like domain-containing protein [Actinomycetota bacterium]
MKRLVVILGVLALVAAGCAKHRAVGVGPADTSTPTPPDTTSPIPEPSNSAPPTARPSPTDTQTSPTPASTVTYEVWFAGDDSSLFLVHRTEPATEAVGRASLTALLGGPSGEESDAGVGTQVPPGTSLVDLSISSGEATVNLSNEYFSGGSAVSEWTRLGQVVCTIDQFRSVDAVTIQLEGDPIKTFDIQGRALHRPWQCGDFEQILPAIVVEEPGIGQTVSSPFTVSGTANVFEATVSYRLLDDGGNEVASGFVTATCGTGCRGDYTDDISYTVDHAQPGTLEVFEESAENGQPINMVRIPLSLEP